MAKQKSDKLDATNPDDPALSVRARGSCNFSTIKRDTIKLDRRRMLHRERLELSEVSPRSLAMRTDHGWKIRLAVVFNVTIVLSRCLPLPEAAMTESQTVLSSSLCYYIISMLMPLLCYDYRR